MWPCTIGLNEKGGMNDEEFDKYINNSIVPLYSDLEDTPGKQVLLKVDSGPGCNGRDLLNKARFQGVYLFPGLPSATSVQQETDINYGPFKSVVCSNLKKIVTLLLGPEDDEIGAVYLWIDCLWRCMPDIKCCVRECSQQRLQCQVESAFVGGGWSHPFHDEVPGE